MHENGNLNGKIKIHTGGGDGNSETVTRDTQNAPGIEQGRKIKSDVWTDTVDAVETRLRRAECVIMPK